MDPLMQIILFYNPKSGRFRYRPAVFLNDLETRIDRLFGDGYTVRVVNATRNNLDELISRTGRNTVRAVLVAGGDGTINSCIGTIIRHGLVLGIIPTGTFNNFARNCNIPLNLDRALDIIARAGIRKVDAAKVNSRFFVNNSSIGMYASSVKFREKTRKLYRLSKFQAMFLSMVRVFHRFPMVYVEIVNNGKKKSIKAPFVFVGNNQYNFSLLNPGGRKSLNRGLLYVAYAECSYRTCLLKIGAKGLLGILRYDPNYRSDTVKTFTIHSRKKIVTVAADGEIFSMKTPLVYQSVPGSIQLLAGVP